MQNLVVDVSPMREVWHRWQVGDPSDLTERTHAISAYLAGDASAVAPQHPWRWLVQPADVVIFGLCHFLLGLWVGWLVDSRLFGPLTSEERESIRDASKTRWPTWWRVLVQATVVLLLFNYMRKTLLLIQPRYFVKSYQHTPVPQMDGGFAMSLGFAWTQRNLVQRLGLILRA